MCGFTFAKKAKGKFGFFKRLVAVEQLDMHQHILGGRLPDVLDLERHLKRIAAVLDCRIVDGDGEADRFTTAQTMPDERCNECPNQ